ncbi:hypothetical protein [Campylobacter helveticus]|uniref:hypothetical protein n=1 Tax=Campylobacter helveticus TaxID=28898 RepID=UPI0009C37D03|nr:hypothetical protein [Campylobacter helveticus]ARE81437.1 hypothetical protein CHELV3228_a0063 [Campylobacter helveticus]TXK53826.1 hypothetical protein A9726_04940 [Campylobacter helveticus]SMC24028.1 hypothetical protein SAMN02745125_01787 [Campylobacter helveticus]SUW87668.1 Uncharacterised protein [Campylobacter helveticus]
MNNIKSFYKNFLEKCERARFNLNQNKIDINENDSYADKTIFAFLADLLRNDQEANLKNILIREVQENEALTKEKFQVILKDQLREYMKLDKDILKAKGLENLDYDKANKLLDNDNFMEFTSELLNNKFEKLNKFAETLKEKGKEAKQITETLQKQDLSIKAKDIQSLSAKASNVMKDKNTQKAIAEGVNIVRKVIMKV